MAATSTGIDVVVLPPLSSSSSSVLDNASNSTHPTLPIASIDWERLLDKWKNEAPYESAPYAFSNDEYGLLNTAKFAVSQMTFITNETSNKYGHDNATAFNRDVVDHTTQAELPNITSSNITTSILLSGAEVVTASPSPYTIYQIVILAMIMTAMMIVIVVGNILVIIATATESNLASVQNWFIASLAVADLLIGLVVMPFSLSYELMGYWMFGELWCDVHAALDVLTCTASIMNICLISLDRYWSITKAIQYLNTRTPRMVMIMIATTWSLSCFISIPPLLGWKESEDKTWFWNILNAQGNRSHMEFLKDIETSGLMELDNFTTTLQSVVYPHCSVS